MEPTLHPRAVRQIRVSLGEGLYLEGQLIVPRDARGVVLFAHGSGSSKHTPRDLAMASALHRANVGTLQIDLLTAEEAHIDRITAHLRFDIELLAQRVLVSTDWLGKRRESQNLPVGYFGSSTGSAAAFVAAASRPGVVEAIVCRGGRPDLAGPTLSEVSAPTLLIVGNREQEMVELNRAALERVRGPKRLEIVQGATNQFDDPTAAERAAFLAAQWFRTFLKGRREVSRSAR